MSFTNINDVKSNDTRSFVMIYNFNAKEVTNLKNICRVFGIKDVEVLNKNNACSKVSEVIDGVISTSEEEGLNHKAIVFNNINHARVNGLIDGLKKFRIGRPLMAFVTDDNVNWTFNNLLLNLVEERVALKQGKNLNH